jgi:mxaJ protein
MCSAFSRARTLTRASLLIVVLSSLAALRSHARAQLRDQAPIQPADDDVLRVCADPNNLPFSNERGEGFENALAQLVANELGRSVRYTWWPQRRGFIRNTLAAMRCDVVMGVPAMFDMVQTTAPYYRSSYVFVTRSGDQWQLQSFDDARLRSARIGVHVIGDDYSNVPPAQVLAAHGLIQQMHGYPIYGAYSRPDPPRELIDAVAQGLIDVAIAWGPLAGYFARIEPALLDIQPVPTSDSASPMSFDISMGVRRGDVARERELERVLTDRAREIHALLQRYGVPLLDAPQPMAAAERQGG